MLLAFILTTIAALSTTIGGLLSFFVRKYNIKILAIGLGFSAGAMIYISLVELLKEANKTIAESINGNYAGIVVSISFFIGILISIIIDYMLPNHFELKSVLSSKTNCPEKTTRQKKLFRIGLFTFIAITIHNFPEGITTFSSTIADVSLGLSVAVAIAIHNIPEGIAIALPIYYATGSKTQALFYSFLSGISEILGAVIGWQFVEAIFNGFGFGILIAITSGFMVYISFDELLPAAREYGTDHLAVIGVMGGMLTMALSLNFLAFNF